MVLSGDDIKNSLARIAMALERVAYNLDRLTADGSRIVFTQVPERLVPDDVLLSVEGARVRRASRPSLMGGGRQPDDA